MVEQLGSAGQVRCAIVTQEAAVDKGQGWVLFTINLGLGIGGYRQGRLGDGQRATHIAEGVVVVDASRAGDRVWAYITVLNSCGRTARFSGQVRCAIVTQEAAVDKGQGWVLFTINLGLGIGGYRQGRLVMVNVLPT